MTYSFNAEEIFHIAITIEQNGEKFYNHITTLVIKDYKTKQICNLIAGEEREHIKVFENLLAELVNKKSSSYNMKEFPEEDLSYLKALSDASVFTPLLDLKEISSKIRNAGDAIMVALGFEKDSILFFTQMKKFTRPEWGQSEINRIIEQEQEHIKILITLLHKLPK
jgi:rubrerythrin